MELKSFGSFLRIFLREKGCPFSLFYGILDNIWKGESQ